MDLHGDKLQAIVEDPLFERLVTCNKLNSPPPLPPLPRSRYTPNSFNLFLTALNSWFGFLNWFLVGNPIYTILPYSLLGTGKFRV